MSAFVSADSVPPDMTGGEFGDCAILDEDLTAARVPAPGTQFWMEVALFALSFDGYQSRVAELGVWANKQVGRFAATGRPDESLTLPDLRAVLFFEQRRVRHLDATPEATAARYVDALLAAIRSCVVAGR